MALKDKIGFHFYPSRAGRMENRESSRQKMKNFENNSEELGPASEECVLEQVEARLWRPECQPARWPLPHSSPKACVREGSPGTEMVEAGD